MLTDKELLERATEFDMGPMPILNGRAFWWEKYPAEGRRYRMSVRKMGNPDPDGPDRWAIFGDSDRSCLAKTGRFEYQSLPSSRTDAFYQRCRYDSLEEAITYCQKWMDAVLAWAKKKIDKAEDKDKVIINWDEIPARNLRFTQLMGK